jgi:hypothetical protein
MPERPNAARPPARSRYRVGLDIGDTFTDFIPVDDETGAVRLHKCLTTPHGPARRSPPASLVAPPDPVQDGPKLIRLAISARVSSPNAASSPSLSPMLPVGYFHLVFTLPGPIKRNQRRSCRLIWLEVAEMNRLFGADSFDERGRTTNFPLIPCLAGN